MLREILKNTPIAKNLTNEEVNILLRVAQKRTYWIGETIIEEDSVGRDVFILISGKVRVETAIPGEHEDKQILYTILPGEVFGEFSFIDGTPRSATIISDEECEVIILSYTEFKTMAKEHTHLALTLMENIAKMLTERIRNINLEFRNSVIWGR